MGLAECDGSDHQVWELDPFTSNASLFAIVDPNGLCVTVDGPTAAPGTLLVLAQCAEMQNQGWVQGGAARPMPVAQGGTYVGGYGGYAEPEYYWYTGHRYCWYDGGWHGGGWYWCGDNFHNGIGWGGPIGWHFWFHFGHKWLPHPVFFKSYLGKPPHKHDVLAIQKNHGHPGGQGAGGNQGGQGGKGNQGGQAGKGNQGAQGGKVAKAAKVDRAAKVAGQGGKGKNKGKSVQGGQGAGGGVVVVVAAAVVPEPEPEPASKRPSEPTPATKVGAAVVVAAAATRAAAAVAAATKAVAAEVAAVATKVAAVAVPVPASKTGKHPSDIRLKQDIVPLARLESGIELYRFRYKGSDPTPYVGVMAQEVQTVMPSAVSLGRNGYLQVDYDRLGLKFMTWDAFVQRHGAELRPAE